MGEKADIMALFGKLFEKKVCSLCGSDIGLLGNRKLADGNCCKKCAAKLSPWFDSIRFNVNDEDVTLENPGMRRPGVPGNPVARREATRYREYEQMCRKICQTVTDAKREAQQAAAAAAKEPELPAFCPACCAPTDGSCFCQFCGTKLG